MILENLKLNLQKLLSPVDKTSSSADRRNPMQVIKKGRAMRVIFFYPGEEGTYVDHADVILYENGIVHIHSNQEETTTHLQNCEILWRFETDAEDRANNVRLIKPTKTEMRAEMRTGEEANPVSEGKKDGKTQPPEAESQLDMGYGEKQSLEPLE
jgi:tRNA G37 N-methylase Trm5